MFLGYSCTSTPEELPVAIIELESMVAKGAKDIGHIEIYEKSDFVELKIIMKNMAPGRSHAIHIHDNLCGDYQTHFNMGKSQEELMCDQYNLGKIWGRPYAGDVGNIEIDEEGNGELIVQSEFWSFETNEKNIADKLIYIHLLPEDWEYECSLEHPDDHVHNNPQIARGVISVLN